MDKAKRAYVKMEKEGSSASKARAGSHSSVEIKGKAKRAYVNTEKEGSTTSKVRARSHSSVEIMDNFRLGEAKGAHVKVEKEGSSTSKARAGSHSSVKIMDKEKRAYVKMEKDGSSASKARAGSLFFVEIMEKIEAGTTTMFICPAYNCEAVLELSPRIVSRPLQERWNAAKYETLNIESTKTHINNNGGVCRKGYYPSDSHTGCKDQRERVSRKGEYQWCFPHTESHKDQLQGLGGYGEQVGEPSQSRVYEICEICYERKKRAGMFTNKSCSHLVCTGCISKHIEVKIENNPGLILCPGLDCRGVLTPERCKEFLPKRVLERWEWTIIQSQILDSEKFYCPFKDCSAMLLNDNAEGAMMMRESECPHCRRLFCVQCHASWHSGMKCREFQRLNANERGREDILLRKLAKEKKWKRCPSCKFYVEKTEGCVHMTCRCGFEFCYRCGGQWSINHGDCQIRQ